MKITFNFNNYSSSPDTPCSGQSNWADSLLTSVITSLATIIDNRSAFDSFPCIKRCILYFMLFLSVIFIFYILYFVLSACISKCKPTSLKNVVVLIATFLITLFLCGCIMHYCIPSTGIPNSDSTVYEELLERIPFYTQAPAAE